MAAFTKGEITFKFSLQGTQTEDEIRKNWRSRWFHKTGNVQEMSLQTIKIQEVQKVEPQTNHAIRVINTYKKVIEDAIGPGYKLIKHKNWSSNSIVRIGIEKEIPGFSESEKIVEFIVKGTEISLEWYDCKNDAQKIVFQLGDPDFKQKFLKTFNDALKDFQEKYLKHAVSHSVV
jgi:hypothetical protein